jgi:hypothetical protein
VNQSRFKHNDSRTKTAAKWQRTVALLNTVNQGVEVKSIITCLHHFIVQRKNDIGKCYLQFSFVFTEVFFFLEFSDVVYAK